jgi:hypothetical protein
MGCGGQPSDPAAQTPSSAADGPTAAATSPPTVASLIAARWVGFETSGPWHWVVVSRQITPDFQLFGFRPVGETEYPRPCQGCGDNVPTAEVKVYAPGKYDPSGAQAGKGR